LNFVDVFNLHELCDQLRVGAGDKPEWRGAQYAQFPNTSYGLCYCACITGLDVRLLQVQIYCRKCRNEFFIAL